MTFEDQSVAENLIAEASVKFNNRDIFIAMAKPPRPRFENGFGGEGGDQQQRFGGGNFGGNRSFGGSGGC